MTTNSATVAICNSHADAEAAVKELQHAGFENEKALVYGARLPHRRSRCRLLQCRRPHEMLGEEPRVLGRHLGNAFRFGVLFGSWHRPVDRGRTPRRLDCWSIGGGRRVGRVERGRGALQPGHSQEQHLAIRGCAQDGKFALIVAGTSVSASALEWPQPWNGCEPPQTGQHISINISGRFL